jgi:hypothetical protein
VSSSDKIRAYFEKNPVASTMSSEALKRLPPLELKQLEGENQRKLDRALDLAVRGYDEGVSEDLRLAMENRVHTLQQARDEIWEAVGLTKDKQMVVDTDLATKKRDATTAKNRDAIAAAHDRLMASVEAAARDKKQSNDKDEEQRVA